MWQYVNLVIKLSNYYGQGNARLELFKVAFKISDSIWKSSLKLMLNWLSFHRSSKLTVFSSLSFQCLSVLMLCWQTFTMMGKWRHLNQHFVTIANYINCNIFIKIWYDSSVITTLLTTKLYHGLIFNGTWHTKLKFIFNKVVTQHPIKGAAAKMVQYYQQNYSIIYISCTNASKIFGSNDT